MLASSRNVPSLTTSFSDDLGNTFDAGSALSVSGEPRDHSIPTQAPKFPHTRAQLSAILREYKPLDPTLSTDSDAENDYQIQANPVLVKQVVALLEEEKEDELKTLLRGRFGMDDETVEHHVLDLMHKHRDDIAGVPFLFLTPTRRPISRPSSRASSHSFRLAPGRPDTPTSAPSSPLLLGPRRPHTPMMSPLGTGTQLGISPASSPTIAYIPTPFASSLPSSPHSSPRLLNAKASEFRPTPRPLSAASSNPASLANLRGDTPSPDLWSHGSYRGTSRLAIASPLLPDQSLLPRSMTPNSSLRSSTLPPEDDDEDPFDPFAGKSVPRSFHPVGSGVSPSDFELSTSSNSASSLSEDVPLAMNPWLIDSTYYEGGSHEQDTDWTHTRDKQQEVDPETAALLTDGMTPFDVLSSVFGATLAPSELEEALANNGYDFERAMQWLVDRALPIRQPSPGRPKVNHMGGVHIVPRAHASFIRGGRAGYGGVSPRGSPRYGNNRPLPGGNRVCRYFLAGECMRADCRFSHDLERALCRFWLRGTCAKGESCEFLHQLPEDIDVSSLATPMAQMDLNSNGTSQTELAPNDDFPTLGQEARYSGYNGNGHYDPGRTRFANAVKKNSGISQSAPAMVATGAVSGAARMPTRRETLAVVGDSVHSLPTVVAPRPSPRIKLRPPSLLPTLPTGKEVNDLYMSYRSRALQLGAARNACLSRAADAWRRGDGAAAKRFSREGHDLNVKMSTEANTAASKLVRERARLAEISARNRSAGWSDDPGDRTSRGKPSGGGMGVCLGIARKDVGGDAKLTPEERTETVLDLHGLHSNEATEVLEQFLLALESEHFLGIAYIVVGEEKHTGTQDPTRGVSRARLATGIREWLHNWGYPWNERDGVIWVDSLTHSQ